METLSPTEHTAEKQHAWDAMKNIVSTRQETHGHQAIEPGVLDTIVVLNLLGIHTSQSCEGHIKHDSVYPFVMIESEKDSEAYAEKAQANIKDYKKFVEIVEKDAEIARQKLQTLLDEYYSHREYNPYNYELAEFRKNRQFMLGPNAMMNTTQKKEAEYKKIILEESQKKLADLTEFLKKKFFEE